MQIRKKQYNPVAEKTYPVVKVYSFVEEGENGESVVSTLALYESKELKDKYFPANGERPYDKAAIEILRPMANKSKGIVANIEHNTTTWKVQ